MTPFGAACPPMAHAMKMRSCSPHRQSVMSLWGFFRSLDGGEAAIDAGRLLSAKRFLLRWESRSALPRLHAHCPRALREVWVVTFRLSSCMSSDRSPVVCRSSVECTAAFDCTTRQQDISSSFSPARMALSPLPAPRLGSVSVFVQLHHCCCLIGPVAVHSLFCAHVASSVRPVACKYPHPLPRSSAAGPASSPAPPTQNNHASLVSMPQVSFQ